MTDKIIDLKNMTIEQLKALAYDVLVQKDNLMNNLQAINQEIALRKQKEKNGKQE